VKFYVMVIGFALVVGAFVVAFADRPVPRCRIVDGHEIDNHHCIPYCPPDPKECG
jgi:hypothetical protein